MLKIDKKYYSLSLSISLTGLFCFFLFSTPVFALNTDLRQVKTANNPAVYFLSHNSQRKKAYINPTSYLSYGNQWSNIQIISQSELDSWITAKLIRTPGINDIYYISGTKKALVRSLGDLVALNLAGEPILEANLEDVAQYQTVDYGTIGLVVPVKEVAQEPGSETSDDQATLMVQSDVVYGTNSNTFVTNTNGNLVGSFKLRSLYHPSSINSIAVSLTGIYNSDILKDAYVRDQYGEAYKANVSLRKDDREAVINFWEPLELAVGEEAALNLFLDLGTTTGVNQVIKAEIKTAAAINSDAVVEAQFPLVGTEFKVFSGDAYVGKVKIEEVSILSGGESISNGSRVIGKFNVSETSANEAFYLKEITFSNSGTINRNDWEDFRLLRDDEIIARVADTNDRGRIEFKINYCRVANDFPAELTVIAALASDYNPETTVNLQAHSLWSVGKVYNFSLPTQISNLNETIILN